MSFSFDFSDDDIDDLNDRDLSYAATQKLAIDPAGVAASCTDAHRNQEVPVVKHDIGQLLGSLPDRISYSTTVAAARHSDRRLLIPRRALFDVRLQTIAESSIDDEGLPSTQAGTYGSKSRSQKPPQPFIGFGDSDIEKDVYEGGFKTWEGAIDLVALLSAYDIAHWSSFDSVIELGCGTGLPSLVLFAWDMSLHANDQSKSRMGRTFTLADYNHDTLRLVTLPNFLLVWAMYNAQDAFDPRPPTLGAQTSSHLAAERADETPTVCDGDGDLILTPKLLTAFTDYLSAHRISISLISGPWVPRKPASKPGPEASPNTFLECLDLSHSTQTLILAAETVYSLDSIAAFSAVLVDILDGSANSSTALIAAKQVYFGVGGGVTEFKRNISESGLTKNGKRLVVNDVEGMERLLVGNAQGVGRWLGEVFLV